jgi:uridylate kinase
MENALIICIPGSLIFRKHALQLSWLTTLARSVESLREKGMNIALVVGESSDTRSAAHAARQFGVSHPEIENALRSSSSLHAALVLRMLAQAHPNVCQSIDETISLLQQGKVPVMLGSQGSLSTEARAAMLAETLSAKLVLFTDIDIPTNTITHSRFSRMAGEAAFRTNQQFIVDPLTAMVLARSKIETHLISDRSVSKLENIVNGVEKVGTRITHSFSQSSRSLAHGELPRDNQEFEPTENDLPHFSRPLPSAEEPASPEHIVRHLG